MINGKLSRERTVADVAFCYRCETTCRAACRGAGRALVALHTAR